MEKLINGITRFKENDYKEHEDLFKNLGLSQKPHTLFIGCSDSRVVPSLITKTLPGELFVVRNVANIVPPYRETEEYVATTSAIEYAVNVLNVENIVVTGHSNCGGCASLYLPEESLTNLSHTKKWLELAHPAREKVLLKVNSDHLSHEERAILTERTNVIEQMNNLLTYPFIKEKHDNNQLVIHGWHYIIESGEVYIFNQETGDFELAN